MRHVISVVVGALLVACGGHYGARPSAPQASSGPRGVEAAGLPYRIVDARTGHDLPEADFWTALGGARAICVGELHDNPHHHWAQLRVVDELSRRRGAALGLGLEMVQRPFQGVLDDWAAHRIDERALLSRTGWADRWGYDFALYRPMLERTVERGGHVVALNAAEEVAKKLSHHGLEALTPAEKAALPEMVLDDATHRAWFDDQMEAMGGADAHTHRDGRGGDDEGERPAGADPARADRIYSVQVLWDETMADSAARWLGGGADRTMVILAGGGHCHDSAIVGRLKRRGIAPVVSVQPIIDTDDGPVAAALASPINDYLFVMSMPTR